MGREERESGGRGESGARERGRERERLAPDISDTDFTTVLIKINVQAYFIVLLGIFKACFIFSPNNV